jgi:hypothetical protein
VANEELGIFLKLLNRQNLEEGRLKPGSPARKLVKERHSKQVQRLQKNRN